MSRSDGELAWHGKTYNALRDKKHLTGINKGRILSAIGTIYKDPITPKGETIKPLRADLKGFWRYRIGDHRLVYTIDIENKQIILIAFASRGDIYES